METEQRRAGTSSKMCLMVANVAASKVASCGGTKGTLTVSKSTCYSMCVSRRAHKGSDCGSLCHLCHSVRCIHLTLVPQTAIMSSVTSF